MFVSVISGADKTTVSVGTGDTSFHPVYASVGNFHNDLRCGHGEAVVPIAFLAIPKGMSPYLVCSCAYIYIVLALGSQEDEEDPEFRMFKKQLYHESLACIFRPLKRAMTRPIVMKCPDGHFRRVIFSIGPFLADYPEQVYLAGTVSGWCPKCVIIHTYRASADLLQVLRLS